MSVLKASTIALSMPDAKVHMGDTAVNVSTDLREMERPVHVRWCMDFNILMLLFKMEPI